jgi:hypothetical protein
MIILWSIVIFRLYKLAKELAIVKKLFFFYFIDSFVTECVYARKGCNDFFALATLYKRCPPSS